MKLVYASEAIRAGDLLTFVRSPNGAIFAHRTDLKRETVHAIAFMDAAQWKQVGVGEYGDTGVITKFDAEILRSNMCDDRH